MANTKLAYLPYPEDDINDEEIKLFEKRFTRDGKQKVVSIPYIPQPVVHRFIANFFGQNSCIQLLDRQVFEVNTFNTYNRKHEAEPVIVLVYRIVYYVDIDGKQEERYIDCIGGANIQRGDINRAIQTASTAAFKNLLKKIGKGLKAYELEDLDSDIGIYDEPEVNSNNKISVEDLANQFKTKKSITHHLNPNGF